LIDTLRHHFVDELDLPPSAIDWLLDLWRVIQVFDDAVDGDAIDPAEAQAATWAALISLPGNPFFCANAAALQPALATAVLKWFAANEAELDGRADERSYMWRAGYYDVVLLVVLLCHGRVEAERLASSVMQMYGEPFADYRKEFPRA